MQTIKELIEDVRAANPAPTGRPKYGPLKPIVGDVLSLYYHGSYRQGVVTKTFGDDLLLRHTDNASRYRDENDRPKAFSRYNADKSDKFTMIDSHTN